MNAEFVESALKAALDSGRLGEARPVAAFVDTDGVGRTVRALRSAFPDHFLHAFAAKANPMKSALELVRDHGMACEVASPGELEQALGAGFDPGQIVYDEPAKTESILRRALELGINVNIDNFQEFDRLERLVGDGLPGAAVGFRLNPQVGIGAISAMSTATATSKFGVALEDAGNRERLLECYLRHEWLNSVHVHVGSQGCELGLMIAGIRKTVDLAKQVNAAAGKQRITVIDIGGGLPVNFDSEAIRPTFDEFAAALERAAPELFSGEYRVITEFGRSILAKNGFMAARVEYTKSAGGRPIALTHAGGQVATRTVFMPESWKLRLSVHDPGGYLKQGETIAQDVGGPLCFAGDLVGAELQLPRIEPGDYIVLHDTGAYYFSNPFYYNVLPAPAVYGVQGRNDGSVHLLAWRRQQTMEQTLAVIG
ncbi:MAG: diaminopimelate decarboxylase [Gammaproteobacteria bacterium]|nr:diaminopimelate decarboxylase [Gammaproteobacteria bacterium]